ncbi:MAG: tyrosine-type recombinase/integrase [Mangrovicoccus sp.]
MVRKKFTTTKVIKGRSYQYFRKDGKYIRLPDDPASEEYDKAYWRLMRGGDLVERKTSWNNLILLYKKSPRWIDLKPITKREYTRYIEYLREKVGTQDTQKFQRKHAIAIQQANSDKPRTANYTLQVISVLFEFAIDLGWRSDNPAKGVRKLKEGEGHTPWPEWAIEAFRAHATPEAALLFELALGTGQRAGDLIKMKWSDFDGQGIYVVQSKTGTKIWVPCTDELLNILRQTKKRGVFILTSQTGAPLTYSGAAQRLTRISKKANTRAYSLHGLRYSAASKLAELGATDAQIAAITGHKARSMVAKYSSGANQKRLADEVVRLREKRTQTERESGKPNGKQK